MSLKSNFNEILLWIGWLLGLRDVVQSGESRYGDSERAQMLYNRIDSDVDGYLMYETESGFPVRVDLTDERIRICRCPKDDNIENVVVENSSLSDEEIELIRVRRDGINHYYVKNLNLEKDIKIAGHSLAERSLAELSKADPPGQPGHELFSYDVIIMSKLAIGFYRRPVQRRATDSLSVDTNLNAVWGTDLQ